MPRFVGRAPELELLWARLAHAAAGRPQVVVVEGAPGMGKTALMQAFLATLGQETVFTASGDEAEAFLRFGVLRQLLGLREGWVDPFAAGADLLQLLDETGPDPTVFVVDDAHLADAESMAALTFAFRRLRADRVLGLVAVRTEDAGRLPSGLLKLAERQDGRIRIHGLTDEEVVALGSTLGHGHLSHRSAARLREHTAGSPLYLRALMRELPHDVLEAASPLPAPESYTSLVQGSVASCSEVARRLVRAASVLEEGCLLGFAAALADIEEPEEALDELVKGHLMTCEYADEGWRLGFAHPLVKAAVHDDLGPLDRRELHLRAAGMCSGDEALFHRLAAASGPDPALAAQIAARAENLRDSGDDHGAAEYFLKAGRLAGQEGQPWLFEAAALFLIAGDVAAAGAAEAALAPDVGGAARFYLRAKIAWFGGQPGLASELATAAWERADELDRSGRGTLAAILAQLHNMQGDGLGAAEWARRALAEALPPDLADSTAAARAAGLVIAGRPVDAFDSLGGVPDDPAAAGPGRHHQLTARGAIRAALDDLDGARRDLDALYQSSPSSLAPQRLLAMGVLAEVDYRLGRWDSSLTMAEQALSLAQDGEQMWVQGYLHAAAVLVSAGRGWWARADEHLAHGRRLAEQLADPATWAVCENAGIHLSSCRGEPEEVVSRSQLLLSLSGPTEEPGWLHWPVQYSAALVQLGRLDEAGTELRRFADLAHRRGSRSRLAGLARVRGELATAQRRHTEARAAFEEAVRLSDAADALEQALVRASYGRFLRRRGERRAARAQLEDARDRFRTLGALPFVEGCHDELAACGVAPDSSAATGTDALTPQERIVVRLACDGLTNQEIARQLVLSAKTIGYHLGNAYAKLGVRSRAQLMAKFTSA